MPLTELEGKGAAKAGGTGVITGPAHLAAKGAARAGGVGTISGPCHLTAGGAARAQGTAVLHGWLKLMGSGTARGGGVGFITDTIRRESRDMEDVWFYGAIQVKPMLGTGAVHAGGR